MIPRYCCRRAGNLALLLGCTFILLSGLFISPALLVTGASLPRPAYEAGVNFDDLFGIPTNQLLSARDQKLVIGETAKTFGDSTKRMLILDFDGTLVDFHPNPNKAVPTRSLRKFFEVINRDEKTNVLIISGRDRYFMEEEFGMYENFILSAEHGAFIKYSKQDGKVREWIDVGEAAKLNNDWKQGAKQIIAKVIKENQMRSQGLGLKTAIETKETGIVFHYRALEDVDPNLAKEMADTVLREIKKFRELQKAKGLELITEHDACAIDTRPSIFTKGVIAKQFWKQTPDADVVICIGDGKTDEDIFLKMREYATEREQSTNLFTFHVNHGKNKETNAEFQLPDVEAVVSLLRTLAGVKRGDNTLERFYKSLIIKEFIDTPYEKLLHYVSTAQNQTRAVLSPISSIIQKTTRTPLNRLSIFLKNAKYT